MDAGFFLYLTLIKFIVGFVVFYFFSNWLLSEKIQEMEMQPLKDPNYEGTKAKKKDLLRNSVILSVAFSVFGYGSEFIMMIPIGFVMFFLYGEFGLFMCFGISFLSAILIWTLSLALVILKEIIL